MTAQNKVKLTNKYLADWVQNSAKGDVVYDTEINNFYAMKNANGTASFKYNYRNAQGKPKKWTANLRFPDLTVDMARRQVKQAIGDIANGIDPNERKKEARREAEKQATFGQYLEGDYTKYQTNNKKSWRDTLTMLRSNFGQWSDVAMTDITPQMIDAWAEKRRSDGIAHDTITRNFGALKTCLNTAERAGVIEANPIKEHKLNRPARTQKDIQRENERRQQRRPLTPDEIKKLFKGLELYDQEQRELLPERLRQQAYADGLTPYINIMFYTGFRNGDVNSLRWEEIDWDAGRIIKLLSKTAHHETKNADIFPIAEPLMQVLKNWHEQSGSPVSGFVFPNPHQNHGHIEDWAEDERRWARVKKLGGLDSKLVLYTLRHHLPSTLLARGESVFIVSKLLGHSDIKTTIKHYAHLMPDDAAAVVDRYTAAMAAVLDN